MVKRRDWRRYERNWRAYERFRRDEVELFLKKAREVVWSIEAEESKIERYLNTKGHQAQRLLEED